MATRFGAANSTPAYKTKLLWAAGALFTIVLILGAAILLMFSTNDPKAAVAASDVVVEATVTDTVDVMVAAVRIEEGQLLSEPMFISRPMDADKAPITVVRAEHQQTVIGKYSKRVINPNMPLVRDDITMARPVNSFKIPRGYRAVTILVNMQSGVEGFAKPNSRVDVLWSYTQEREQKIATIVRFVKILSVGGQTQAAEEKPVLGENTPVTVLATERDAKKIELARTMGQLSLSLVGDSESGSTDTRPDSMGIEALIGRPAVQEEEPNDGEMMMVDPETGAQVRYELRAGRWVRDTSFQQ